MTTMPDPQPGELWWAYLDPAVGCEQGGRRPIVVISSRRYLKTVDTLLISVPVTSVDRGWPNHVPLTGQSDVVGWAVTEQPRVLSRDRLSTPAGQVSTECLKLIRQWVHESVSD
ncbi:type II toxin-antitoxin system PemK/MazF family toxin [Nesterenkonia sp. MY13]|uniref:Type II toxin-antitoxin system PemK/MazF family toxin n=2 Tax=Nesterenkonia sedimenti TaxID=1463632 RepID=A0A7X8TJ95_9MICC|nr:type II toxin-antitoxin system PemK/MazF family toxin [Nesterenkonia sedimenti]